MHFSRVIVTAYAFVPIKEIQGLGLMRKLTVFHKYEHTRIPLYCTAGGKWFGMPIHFDENVYKNAKVYDNRKVGKMINFNFKSSYRHGQEKIIKQFESYYLNGKTGFILEAKPGSGKTVLAIKMMQIVGFTSIVIVPRENLVWQWRDRILEHSDIREKDVGIVCGNRVDYGEYKIMIALVHTCATGKIEDFFFKQFGCIVFDEVHSSVPPQTFSPVLGMFPAKIRIGMSATMKRDDGLDKIFKYHIGQVYLHGNVGGRMKAKVLVHYFRQHSGSIYSGLGTKQRRGMLISKLSENIIRNKLIVRYILSFVKSERRVAILSDRKEQLITLCTLLEQAASKYNLSSIKIGFYVGTLRNKKIKQDAIKNIAHECEVIFATYQKFDLGTDIKDLAGIIYATPHKNVEQKQGRAERWVSGKKDPIIVDIVDTYYNDAVRWFKSRNKFYQAAGVGTKNIV